VLDQAEGLTLRYEAYEVERARFAGEAPNELTGNSPTAQSANCSEGKFTTVNSNKSVSSSIISTFRFMADRTYKVHIETIGFYGKRSPGACEAARLL